METVRLKKGADRRVRSGHLWIYSNEVEAGAPALPAGEVVRVVDARGSFVAWAAWNPRTLIAGRVLAREPDARLGPDLIRQRLVRALELRARIVPGRTAFRHVHGEADELPGLVIDRYGDLAVVQPNSAWADRELPAVLEALGDLPGVRSALVRADSSARELEGLPRRVEVGFGEVPEGVEVDEAGLRIGFSPRTGQKTGLFLDMRDNRDRCAPWFEGARVLDLFGYVGQWAVRAAAAGAREVLTVDSSAEACAHARANAERNGLADRVEVLEGDVFEVLKAQPRGRWDVVVCDPPAFVKSRRHLEEGTARYHRLNQLAARVVADGGLLVTASCSRNLPEEALREIAASAVRRHGGEAVQVFRGGQSADHPILPRHPESAYLKCFAFAVRRSSS